MTAEQQAAINARMQPWGDREIARFSFRVGLFQRRGLPEPDAELLADTLALRDQERDDRRVCLECKQLQKGGGCFAAAQGWLKAEGISTQFRSINNLLQRCGQFSFVTP